MVRPAGKPGTTCSASKAVLARVETMTGQMAGPLFWLITLPFKSGGEFVFDREGV